MTDPSDTLHARNLRWQMLCMPAPLDHDRPMLPSERAQAIEYVRGWLDWQELVPADHPSMPVYEAQLREVQATIQRVRGVHRDTDIRNLIIEHALSYDKSLSRVPADAESAAEQTRDRLKMLFKGIVRKAESLNTGLGHRLQKHKADVLRALELLPSGRREVIYVLTNALSDKPNAIVWTRHGPGKSEHRSKAVDRFDNWRKTRAKKVTPPK